MKKQLIALFLAVLMVFALVACTAKTPATDAPATDAPAADTPATDAPATDAPAADTPAADAPAEKKVINLGLANISETNSFGKLVKMGFEEACEKRGWTLTYVNNNLDGPTAVNNARILASSEVDFVVNLNVDQSVAGSIMDVLNEAGIPAMGVDISLGEDVPFFGVNSAIVGTVNGEYAAEYIKENWDGKVDHVVLFTQMTSGDEVNKRVRNSVEALEAAGIEVGEVTEIDAKGDTPTAQSMFASFLSAHPDSDKIACFSINEFPATGAYAAAVMAEREWDIRIFSASCSDQFVSPMYRSEGNQSWISTVAFFPEKYGEQACQIIEDYFATGEIALINDAHVQPIDWSNINEFYPLDNLPWEKIRE